MEIRRLEGAFVRVVISVAFAGLFYIGWLAVFLAVFKDSGVPVKAVLWAVAPVITASGFAVGMIVAGHLTRARRAGFFQSFYWPLVGGDRAAADWIPDRQCQLLPGRGKT